jgi:hypothetical protein
MRRRGFLKRTGAAALATVSVAGIFVAEWVQTGRVSFLRHIG